MTDNQTASSSTPPLSMPVAILLGSVVVALGVFFGLRGPASAPVGNAQPQAPQALTGNLEAIRPISADDHIRGNPNAPVKIVEYSDFECPFCKRFHETMQQVMSEYGDQGQVAWVYRHLPLDQLHSKARKEAVASECAAELGGNDAFWKFTDRFMELTPSNDQTDIAMVLPQIAREIGLNEAQFTACLASGKYDKHIEEDAQNAAATGGSGTPWSVIIGANGKKYPLSGAQPYEAIKQLVDTALTAK